MVGEAFMVRGSNAGSAYHYKENSVHIESNGLIIDLEKSQKEIGRDIHMQLKAQEERYKIKRSNATNLRMKVVISPERTIGQQLTKEEWAKLSRDVMGKMGYDLKDHPFHSQVHYDTKTPHMHLEISAVNFQGDRIIKSQSIGSRLGKAVQQVCKERGWKSGKEIGAEKKKQISSAISRTAAVSQTWASFGQKMDEKGYKVIFSENDAKGVYGMRIVEKSEYTDKPSERQQAKGQGYKLSEIPISAEKKATIKFIKLQEVLRQNLRQDLSLRLQVAASQSKNWEQLKDKMQLDGFQVMITKDNDNKISNLSVAVPDKATREGSQKVQLAEIPRIDLPTLQAKLDNNLEKARKEELTPQQRMILERKEQEKEREKEKEQKREPKRNFHFRR